MEKIIEYRELMENEIFELLDLYEQLEQNEVKINEIEAKKIWKIIKSQNIKYFIAKNNGKIISSCYICIIPNFTRNGKSIGFIENVITDKEFRRKGIGRKVIKNAIEYAKRQNCYKIILQSGIKRNEAHKFYESIGFNGETKKAYEIRL